MISFLCTPGTLQEIQVMIGNIKNLGIVLRDQGRNGSLFSFPPLLIIARLLRCGPNYAEAHYTLGGFW